MVNEGEEGDGKFSKSWNIGCAFTAVCLLC